jgi:3-hydroxybutyryl-CoA dehydrogenase
MKNGQELGPVGLAGLGLLGRGIATCLLSNGFEVVAYNRTAQRGREAVAHIGRALDELVKRKLVTRARVKDWQDRFRLERSLDGLAACPFVIESVKEDLKLKREIFYGIEAAVAPSAVVASNTSSYPIGLLQRKRKNPARFIGMHWAEPAELTRYLEIVPGEKTSPETVRLAKRVGELCGKEPTVLNFDIRGFISNRLMYAMLREACNLVELGVADLETVDRSFRNDIGWWATIAGPFRWMDLTGIPAYATVAEGLFPKLSNAKAVPKMMRDAVARGALGISNAKGFYKYDKRSAKEWEKAWVDFTYDLRKLVEKYEKRVEL